MGGQCGQLPSQLMADTHQLTLSHIVPKAFQIVSRQALMKCRLWKHTESNRQRDRKKYVMISGGFVIPALQNNSLNDSTQHSLEPTQYFKGLNSRQEEFKFNLIKEMHLHVLGQKNNVGSQHDPTSQNLFYKSGNQYF